MTMNMINDHLLSIYERFGQLCGIEQYFGKI